ncbi:hypothetical protein [Massilia antarctica]|uniref:hypothetical protein n=1 Tax=Massilia antarctica TaxID=2765360 RepID=UPI0035A65474
MSTRIHPQARTTPESLLPALLLVRGHARPTAGAPRPKLRGQGQSLARIEGWLGRQRNGAPAKYGARFGTVASDPAERNKQMRFLMQRGFSKVPSGRRCRGAIRMMNKQY